MLPKKKTVAVVIVSYNGREWLDACLTSLDQSRSSDVDMRVYVVDNASHDGTPQYVSDRWPEIRLIISDTNRGYAGGCTMGWAAILRDLPHVDYLCILNQDTRVKVGFLDSLVRVMDADASVGSAQPLLMSYPDVDTINSLGNVIHFLGFGYSSYCGQRLSDSHVMPETINYASGAALLIRADAIRKTGLFDDFMFMYLEDLDLGWRLSLAGYRNVLVPESVVYHEYDFKRGMRQIYFFERNRLWIILKNYKLRTLLLILPGFLIMEAGQIAYAMARGYLGKKLRAYLYFFNPAHIALLLRDRRKVQRMRVRSDRELIGSFSGVIRFQPIASPLLVYIANPFFSLYHRLLKVIIRW